MKNWIFRRTFEWELKAYKTEGSTKHPEGVKTRFALIDVRKRKPRLVIDNHAPFGFHVHEGLPENKSRRKLLTKDYMGALDEFWRLTREILKNEDSPTRN